MAKRFKKQSKSNTHNQSEAKRWAEQLKTKARAQAKQGNYQDAFADEQAVKGKFPSTKAIGKNDPKWYYKSEQLLKDVASFSFMTSLGSLLPTKVLAPNRNQDAAYMSIPGLMAITLVPVPGISIDATSPLNIGAQNVYSFVRYKNSGAKNYDAPDLMLYYLAMDSIYSAWNWAQRLYGMASVYSSQNKYMPKAWFKASHVSMESVLDNLADFRAGLNTLADKISAFVVPSIFNYMVRHSWLFSNIYMDSQTTKAQQYMFVPGHFYKYDETSSLHGGRLIPVNIASVPPTQDYTYTQVLNIINDMVDALQYSEDIGIMSGDTLKAYGEGVAFKLSHIPDDYKVMPTYRREVLSQIENATLLPWGTRVTLADLNSYVIHQDPNTNYIKCMPTHTDTENGYGDSAGKYLNFHWDSPTPQDVMEASRLNVAYTGKMSGTDKISTINDCGTELALRADVYWYSQKAKPGTKADGWVMSLQTRNFSAIELPSTPTVSNATVVEQLLNIWLWCSFDWAPELWNSAFTGEDASGWFSHLPFRDWDVFTSVTRENQFAMNQLALLSMFDVPN